MSIPESISEEVLEMLQRQMGDYDRLVLSTSIGYPLIARLRYLEAEHARLRGEVAELNREAAGAWADAEWERNKP